MPKHRPLDRKPLEGLEGEEEGEFSETETEGRASALPPVTAESLLAGMRDVLARHRTDGEVPLFPPKTPEEDEAVSKSAVRAESPDKETRPVHSLSHEEIAEAILDWRGNLAMAARALRVRRHRLAQYIDRYPALLTAVEEGRQMADDEKEWALHLCCKRGETGALRLWSESERGIKRGFTPKAGAGGPGREITVRLTWAGRGTPALAPGTDGGGGEPHALPSPGLRTEMGQDDAGGLGSDGQGAP